MLYVKKPIEVEAYQIKEHNIFPLWISDKIDSGEMQSVYLMSMPPKFSHIEMQTDSGYGSAYIGDYVVKGTVGEVYPVKKDIFFDIYDYKHTCGSCKYSDLATLTKLVCCNEYKTSECVPCELYEKH